MTTNANSTPEPTPDGATGSNPVEAEVVRLKAELAEANKKLTVQSRYTELRQKAEKLRGEAKISAPEFDNVFGEISADVAKLTAMPPEELNGHFAGMNFWLNQSEKRSPLLPLDRLSQDPGGTTSATTTTPSSGDGGAAGKEFMNSYQPKKLY